MNFRQLLAVAAAASLLVPGTALAGKGNGKPTGKPGSAPAAQVVPGTFKIRTLEGPETSPETVETPTVETPESGDVVAVPDTTKAERKAAKKAAQAARKAAKKACKGLSKKRVKGKKGTPYSRCIVAAAKRRKQPPVEEAPVETTPEPTEPVVTEPAPPVEEPAAPAEPTEPVVITDPVVEAPAV